MPSPPSVRSTRSNSSPSSITLMDIKQLLEDNKKEIVNTLQPQLNSISMTLDSVSKRVESIENSISAMKVTISKHDVEINDINETLATLNNELPGNILEEMDERLHRLNNVIVSGITETSGSLQDRIEYDKTKIEEIITEIGDPINQDCIVKIQRICRIVTGRPRLLRLILRDKISKNALLESSRKLRTSRKFRDVYVNPDRTPMQAKEFKDLRDELHERKSNGEDVVIFRRRVIARQTIFPRNFQ